jgi:hypothetical protein
MNLPNSTPLTNNLQNQVFSQAATAAATNVGTNQMGTTQNEGLQEALNLVTKNDFLKKITSNISGLNSNTYKELEQAASAAPGLIDNIKDKFISKLESEKIQTIIKNSSIEFGKRLGMLGNAILINDNPFVDVFFSVKSVFDMVLYQFFNILLFINIVILNVDETVAINNFNSNISNSTIIDNFLLSVLYSVRNIAENLLQSVKNEAFSIIFKHYKTDDKTADLIRNLSTEIIRNTVHNFFEIIYISNLNFNQHANRQKQTLDPAAATVAAAAPTPPELMTPKQMGGKLRKLKTKKQKILNRIKTYLANFHNTNHKYKSKTLKRKGRRQHSQI